MWRSDKTLAVGGGEVTAPICLNNQTLEGVESFTYLGSSSDESGKASV